MKRKSGKIEISGENDNQRDDKVRQSDGEMKEDCGENCPEWRKRVTGSGEVEREMYETGSGGERDRQRQTEREIDSDRGRDRRAV